MIRAQKKYYGAEAFNIEEENFFKLEFSTNKPLTELSEAEIIKNMDLLFDELDKLLIGGKNKDAEASVT